MREPIVLIVIALLIVAPGCYLLYVFLKNRQERADNFGYGSSSAPPGGPVGAAFEKRLKGLETAMSYATTRISGLEERTAVIVERVGNDQSVPTLATQAAEIRRVVTELWNDRERLQTDNRELDRQLKDTAARLQRLEARLPFAPLADRSLGVVERGEAMLTNLWALETADFPDIDRSFLRQCRREIDSVLGFVRALPASPPWIPTSHDLNVGLPGLIDPQRAIPTCNLSRSNGERLRSLQAEVDALRLDVAEQLARRFGISEIPAIPWASRFDTTLHEDQEVDRVAAPSQDQANLIYARMRPGFFQNGLVLQRAFVKRLIEAPSGGGSESPAAPVAGGGSLAPVSAPD